MMYVWRWQAVTCVGSTGLAGGGADAGAAALLGPAPPALAMAASASDTGTNFGANLQHVNWFGGKTAQMGAMSFCASHCTPNGASRLAAGNSADNKRWRIERGPLTGPDTGCMCHEAHGLHGRQYALYMMISQVEHNTSLGL